jgi:hypothetical protein
VGGDEPDLIYIICPELGHAPLLLLAVRPSG